ncbi:MAG TPA: LuxR C-terminal-related transcriptional regulator [Ktedonobacterales bacterium]
MPRRATHLLRWSPERGAYELYQFGEPLRPLIAPDTPGWVAWLADASSFSFQRADGATFTLRKEKVQRGNTYWYAYHRASGRIIKRYLGRNDDLTLARLEDIPSSDDRYVTTGDERHPARRGRLPRRGRSTGPATDTPLLATRMLMPRTPARLVTRTHVWHRLQRGMERPLTLLTAPPGFGKTTSLAAWVRQVETPVAWVSLDVSDNEPEQFWAYVLSALEQASPGITGGALAMLRSIHAPPLPIILRALLNAVVGSPRDVVLVLDDYHHISESIIHETLAALLDHPPTQLHLYLASRQEPPLPLARLRARDEVNEIRADDLRFRLDEVAEFLSGVMDMRLPFEDVLALAERTDGWIAGLQLAGLSLQQHPDPAAFVASFNGSHRHIMQYLGDEALAAQPADVRAFLLRTSLLDRMSAPLCDALTGRHDSRALLDRIVRANLFVVALDDEGRWYRYYHLFADLLRHHLHEEAPELVPDLHRKAARWLENDGQITEAAHHLFAIPDFDAAAGLLERIYGDLIRRGDIVTLTSLLERLPTDMLAERPALSLAMAEACYARGQLAASDRHIAAAERAVARMPTATADDQRQQRILTGRIAADRAVLSSMHGAGEAAFVYSQKARELLADDDSLHRAGVFITVGHAWRFKGDLVAADNAYAEAARLSFEAGSPFLGALATDMRMLVANARGHLHLSANLSRQIIALAESRGEAARSLAGNGWSNLGWRLYEWNDLDGAEEALRQALALGEQWGDVEDQVDSHLWLALVYQAQGKPEQARASLQRADDLLREGEQSGQTFPWLPPIVIVASARLALMQGRLADAEHWMAAIRDGFSRDSAIRVLGDLTCVRVLLALGEAAEAQSLLDDLLLRAMANGETAYEIEARMLQALTWQASGETTRAINALGQATAQAMPEGYIRLFLDEGAPMIALLKLLRDHPTVREDVAGYCTKLLVLAGAEAWATAPATPQPRTHSELAEPLSAREIEVLRLLAKGYSNQEIASELVIALSTVKTHVHHLYAKLQTPDRLRAVTRARALGLLGEDTGTYAPTRHGRLA